MDDLYVLDEERRPRPEADVQVWGKCFELADRIVQVTQITATVQVSTVFLGIDHSFGHGPPILWETMIFGGRLSEEQERYQTYEQALAGHARMCWRARHAKHWTVRLLKWLSRR